MLLEDSHHRISSWKNSHHRILSIFLGTLPDSSHSFQQYWGPHHTGTGMEIECFCFWFGEFFIIETFKVFFLWCSLNLMPRREH